MAVVLDLHGSGGTSAGQARNSGFEDVAAREGFVVASLQADAGRWNVPVRGDEWLESVPEALAGWAGHNGCDPKVIMGDPAGPLSTMRYTGCRDSVEVRMIRIDGLGHAWTRKEIDTTEVMWQLFKSHRRPLAIEP